VFDIKKTFHLAAVFFPATLDTDIRIECRHIFTSGFAVQSRSGD